MKIAHISDFHLRYYLEGDDVGCGPDLITEAARHIAAHAPDLVAVTGDLVDYPLDALDDPDTIALGEKDLLLVRECFDGLSCPVVYVYGNHDHPASFRRVFCDQLFDFDVQGFRVITFFDEEGDHHVPRRVGADRARFQSVVSDGDPRPQIHLQHYLIFPEHSGGYPFNYGDAAELKAALVADSRCKLVLSGHYHKGEDLVSKGHVFFATARAFCDPPHPFRVYEFADADITQAEYTL
ncbi:MAG: metallophosphoesterase [Gemmatimonadetes bacterium]|nr:metallophosphoesterase [Gemmatimonadota bacterium]